MDTYLGITIVGSFLPLVFGCSPEVWVEPTLGGKTHYAKIVLVGNVTGIIDKDPANMDVDTYGAEVYVQCTYKGGILPGYITIGGAGFIRGMCNAMDLERHKKYIIFLDEKQEKADFYMQSGAAEPVSNVRKLTEICNLEMNYPEENGMTMKRRVCEDATTKSTCKRYQEPHGPGDRQPGVKTGKHGESPKDPGGAANSLFASLGLLLTSFLLYFM